MRRVTDVTAARFLFIKDGMKATEVPKVRCLGGHMCDRNQPLMEETRATDVVIMGAPGNVSMVRRLSEVDQLILLSPKLHGDASRAVRDSWNIHRCGFSRMRKWHTNWNPGVHGREYTAPDRGQCSGRPAQGLVGASAVAGHLGGHHHAQM
ncbi:hypothetical protein PoB_000898200 [Plakobranchus ocellatus]|uniref:Lactate/malate dehydrogenase N-terminal domain-containing protein n=1 Tax=Plakobranchus ocellatus TaxID=259542 RepID=A0AAV3YJU6_9GAST|nr:hypothetical protein PoB_000898200 [Plakobranchus ocellatus]